MPQPQQAQPADPRPAALSTRVKLADHEDLMRKWLPEEVARFNELMRLIGKADYKTFTTDDIDLVSRYLGKGSQQDRQDWNDYVMQHKGRFPLAYPIAAQARNMPPLTQFPPSPRKQPNSNIPTSSATPSQLPPAQPTLSGTPPPAQPVNGPQTPHVQVMPPQTPQHSAPQGGQASAPSSPHTPRASLSGGTSIATPPSGLPQSPASPAVGAIDPDLELPDDLPQDQLMRSVLDSYELARLAYQRASRNPRDKAALAKARADMVNQLSMVKVTRDALQVPAANPIASPLRARAPPAQPSPRGLLGTLTSMANAVTTTLGLRTPSTPAQPAQPAQPEAPASPLTGVNSHLRQSRPEALTGVNMGQFNELNPHYLDILTQNNPDYFSSVANTRQDRRDAYAALHAAVVKASNSLIPLHKYGGFDSGHAGFQQIIKAIADADAGLELPNLAKGAMDFKADGDRMQAYIDTYLAFRDVYLNGLRGNAEKVDKAYRDFMIAHAPTVSDNGQWQPKNAATYFVNQLLPHFQFDGDASANPTAGADPAQTPAQPSSTGFRSDVWLPHELNLEDPALEVEIPFDWIDDDIDSAHYELLKSDNPFAKWANYKSDEQIRNLFALAPKLEKLVASAYGSTTQSNIIKNFKTMANTAASNLDSVLQLKFQDGRPVTKHDLLAVLPQQETKEAYRRLSVAGHPIPRGYFRGQPNYMRETRASIARFNPSLAQTKQQVATKPVAPATKGVKPPGQTVTTKGKGKY